jgi:hypothetical protein
MNWCLLNYSEGQTCLVNWTAAQTISTAFLTAVLILITAYYAIQTRHQVTAMQNQVTAIQNQINLMRDQLTWDRTYKPRMDAYTRFMQAIVSHSADVPHMKYVVIPQLGLVPPYSSNEVNTKASELYKSIQYYRHQGYGDYPPNTLDRINTELKPIMENEIEKIMRQEETQS